MVSAPAASTAPQGSMRSEISIELKGETKMSKVVHEKMSGGQWVAALRKDPALAGKCEWEKLSGDDWRRLLKDCPQFADKCAWGKLSGKNWQRLLATQPQFADKCDWSKLDGEDLKGLLKCRPDLACKAKDWIDQDEQTWMWLLSTCPNNTELVSRCDKWNRFPVESAYDLLLHHPQLGRFCPDDVWCKFKFVHWARLIRESGERGLFVDKMKELSLDKRLADFCCLDHWAEEYCSFFKRPRHRAAATQMGVFSHEETVQWIAENSAINPYCELGSRSSRFRSDIPKHIQWLSSVAADCAAAAKLAAVPTCPRQDRAEEYALIAEAANYEIQVLTAGGGCRSGRPQSPGCET